MRPSWNVQSDKDGGSQMVRGSQKLIRYAGYRWLTPVIPATQEAVIRKITVPSQPGQIICEALPRKNSSPKRAGGVA
jgi:hypothetical protein